MCDTIIVHSENVYNLGGDYIMRVDDFKHILSGAKELVNQGCPRGELIMFFNRMGINITPFMLKGFMKNLDKVEDYNVTINL